MPVSTEPIRSARRIGSRGEDARPIAAPAGRWAPWVLRILVATARARVSTLFRVGGPAQAAPPRIAADSTATTVPAAVDASTRAAIRVPLDADVGAPGPARVNAGPSPDLEAPARATRARPTCARRRGSRDGPDPGPRGPPPAPGAVAGALRARPRGAVRADRGARSVAAPAVHLRARIGARHRGVEPAGAAARAAGAPARPVGDRRRGGGAPPSPAGGHHARGRRGPRGGRDGRRPRRVSSSSSSSASRGAPRRRSARSWRSPCWWSPRSSAGASACRTCAGGLSTCSSVPSPSCSRWSTRRRRPLPGDRSGRVGARRPDRRGPRRARRDAQPATSPRIRPPVPGGTGGQRAGRRRHARAAGRRARRAALHPRPVRVAQAPAPAGEPGRAPVLLLLERRGARPAQLHDEDAGGLQRPRRGVRARDPPRSSTGRTGRSGPGRRPPGPC